MAHRTARLNLFGRRLLVTRIAVDGWPIAKAAEAQGVSRTTAHKWIARYRAEGWSGLEDRSSRPHHSPRLTPPEQVAAILRARIERRWGPHRLAPLLGLPRSTVYAVLARSGYSRLRDADRLSGVPVRYVRDHPGALIHQDHKKLGRIPDGGGHRLLGRSSETRRRRSDLGYDHFEVVVDDATRLAYVAHVPNESASSASRALLDAAVWFAERGVRIERVMTDNAWAYTSPTFARAVESLDARHKRTRPHRPQTNGKAERFIKTLLAEWAYGRLYRTNAERLDALPSWTAYYNDKRTHTALGGITPMEALLNNLHGNHI
ncbi:MAG TPA: IS481 family transposase [Methylomirabilota bacterium]|nr:IS481 family transposase [Methylomirabilota bacterium]